MDFLLRRLDDFCFFYEKHILRGTAGFLKSIDDFLLSFCKGDRIEAWLKHYLLCWPLGILIFVFSALLLIVSLPIIWYGDFRDLCFYSGPRVMVEICAYLNDRDRLIYQEHLVLRRLKEDYAKLVDNGANPHLRRIGEDVYLSRLGPLDSDKISIYNGSHYIFGWFESFCSNEALSASFHAANKLTIEFKR